MHRVPEGIAALAEHTLVTQPLQRWRIWQGLQELVAALIGMAFECSRAWARMRCSQRCPGGR